MEVFCLWLSNRRSLLSIDDEMLIRRRPDIIQIFGNISVLISKSSQSMIEEITNKAINEIDYKSITSISTFRELLLSILNRSSNLSWDKHEELNKILSGHTFDINTNPITKIKKLEINDNYLRSPIYRIDDDLLLGIFGYLQLDEHWVLTHVCYSWLNAVCSMTSDQYQVQRKCNLTRNLWSNKQMIDHKYIINKLYDNSDKMEKILDKKQFNLIQLLLIMLRSRSYGLSKQTSLLWTLQTFERIFKRIGKKEVEYPFDLKLLIDYIEQILSNSSNYNINRYCLSMLQLMIKYHSMNDYLFQHKQSILEVLLSKLNTNNYDSAATQRTLSIICKIMCNSYKSMLKISKSLIENILYHIINHLRKNPNLNWREQLKANDDIVILTDNYSFRLAKIVNIDEFTDYILVHIRGKQRKYDQWISRYSSHIQCATSINPNIYIRYFELFSNIVIPWTLARKLPISIMEKYINPIISQLSCLEKKQHEIITDDGLTIERGYLVYWLTRLNKEHQVLIPHDAYILCLYLFDLMANTEDDIDMDHMISFDAKCFALLKAAAIQTNHIALLSKLDEFISLNQCDLKQVNKFDYLINKTMIKYKLYVIVTPYIFHRIYCQKVLYQCMDSMPLSKQKWTETRLMMIKNIKKQVGDSNACNPSSRIAISSISDITSEQYPYIKSINIGV